MDISVIIPAYNRVNSLARAIESVLDQTHKVAEIIVIDDGSTDATSEVVKVYEDVLLLRQKNMGVSSARNNGIMMASSEWIAFLDSDDTWHRDKIAKQVALHKKEPQLKFSYTDEKWIHKGKETTLSKKSAKSGGDIFAESLSECTIASSSTIVKKSLLTSVGLFDESLEVCEDYDLWLRILSEHEIGLVDEKLITKYSGHDDQLSMQYWGLDRFRVRGLEKHLDGSHDVIVRKELIVKYELLLKEALKHERHDDHELYLLRIDQLRAGY